MHFFFPIKFLVILGFFFVKSSRLSNQSKQQSAFLNLSLSQEDSWMAMGKTKGIWMMKNSFVWQAYYSLWNSSKKVVFPAILCNFALHDARHVCGWMLRWVGNNANFKSWFLPNETRFHFHGVARFMGWCYAGEGPPINFRNYPFYCEERTLEKFQPIYLKGQNARRLLLLLLPSF